MIAEHAIDWSTQWREEGREEGRQQGRQEGEAAVLQRLARRKFGPLSSEVVNRIQTADPEQLLEWADRLLTAAAVEEIFDGQPSR